MHINEFKRFLRTLVLFFDSVLPIVFWVSLIFSFDSPEIATTCIIAIATHELGHIIAIYFCGGFFSGIRGTVSGLRIKGVSKSYVHELFVYLGGPLANFLFAAFFFIFFNSDYTNILFTVNLTTCISNLLPIEGYDGYGVLRCIIMQHGITEFGFSLISAVSFLTTGVLAVIALYMIDRLGEGYWIFFVFFISTLKNLGNGLKKAKNEQ